LYTHWARPRVRTYQYNYEYGESYYRPLVRYISTSRALSQSSTSSYSSSSSYSYRRSRQGSPPGALSFIERWAHEPFYGYGIGFRSRLSSERSLSSAFQSALSSSSQIAQSLESSRSLRAQSVSRSLRAQSVAAMQRESSVARSSVADIRSSRARSLASRFASDDCLMRSTALNRARAASEEIMNTSSLCNKTLVIDDQNILHGRTLDRRHYLDYPQQHLVCSENCPLHNCPEWRRRFLIGNRFLDAAALGGFDVLYDPSVYRNSRRLLSRLSERNESDSEELLIQRSSESDASRRRIRATSYFI